MIEVEFAPGQVAEFPDDYSEDQIYSAINEHTNPQPAEQKKKPAEGVWIGGEYYPPTEEISAGFKLPERKKGFLSSFREGMGETPSGIAATAMIASQDDAKLKNLLQAEFKRQTEEAKTPLTTLEQAGRMAGGLAGGLVHYLGTSPLGPLGPAVAFGTSGYGQEFIKAGTRALAEGKSEDEALAIAKAAAPVGAAASGGQALILPPSQQLATAPLKTAGKEAAYQGAGGGLGQLATNVAERQLGLQTPVFEGVPTATLSSAAIPLGAYGLLKGLGTVANRLLTPTKGTPDAIQVGAAEKTNVRTPPRDSQAVGEGIPESGQAAEVRPVTPEKEGKVNKAIPVEPADPAVVADTAAKTGLTEEQAKTALETETRDHRDIVGGSYPKAEQIVIAEVGNYGKKEYVGTKEPVTTTEQSTTKETSLKDQGVSSENIKALLNGTKTASQVIDEQLGIFRDKDGNLSAKTMIVESAPDGGTNVGFSPEAGPARSVPHNYGEMSPSQIVELAREQGIEAIENAMSKTSHAETTKPIATKQDTEFKRLTSGKILSGKWWRKIEALEPDDIARIAAELIRKPLGSWSQEMLFAATAFRNNPKFKTENQAAWNVLTDRLANEYRYEAGIDPFAMNTAYMDQIYQEMAKGKPASQTKQGLKKEAPATKELLSPTDLAKKAQERLRDIGVGKGVSIEDLKKQQAIKGIIDTGKTAYESLKALAEGEHFSGLNQELAGWLVKLGDLGVKKTTGGEYYSEKFKTKAAGRYNPETDTVHVYDAGFNNLKGEQTFLHEYVHALTHKAIDSGKHAVPLTRLFNGALEKAQKAGIEFHALSQDIEGGVTKANLHEFVAEVMSNDKFQQFLKSQKSATGGKFKTMWDDFVNAVANMFGIDRSSSLYDSLRLSMDLAYSRKAEMEAGKTGVTAGNRAEFAGYMLGETPQVNIPGSRPGIKRTVSIETAKELGYEIPEIPTKEQWKTQQTEAATASLSPELRQRLESRMAGKSVTPVADVSVATTEPTRQSLKLSPESPAQLNEQAVRTADAVQSVGEGQHPGGPKEFLSPAGTSPGQEININRRQGDYGILNKINSPQFLFYFGKFGEYAKKAWETMALGEFGMRESIARDVRKYVTDLRAGLPKEFRKQSGKLFFEILDGRTIQDIEQAHPDQPKVIEAARSLKDKLETVRQDIRNIKHDGYAQYLDSLTEPSLQDLYRNSINQTLPQGITKADLVAALADAEYPADWGIADGTYIPHLFAGTWKITGTDANGTFFVSRAKTPQEAKVKIAEAVKANPALADASFNVEQDMAIPPDMLRLFDRRFFKMVNEMKDHLGVSADEIKMAQRGIIGRKSSKQKWFGSLQERIGYEGYSKDFDKVLTSYLSGYHRWKNLTAINREVIPLIERVKAEYPYAAQRLEGLLENLWGKPSKITKEFDNTIQKIPLVRDYVPPLALDTIARKARSLAVMAHLRTIRYALLNRLQPLQGLYPIVGEKTLAQAKIMQHTNAGKQLLDEFGVKFDAGQFSEPGLRRRFTDLRERITGEKSNQELAFLAMYQHARNQGMTHAEAGKYGKLRGQLMTQFTPLVVDTPELLEGPIGQTLFQYKRFPIKQAELIGSIVKGRNVPAAARLIGTFALMGGASYFMRQSFLSPDTRRRVQRYLDDELGEGAGKMAFYGLPGYLGTDISGSLTMGEDLTNPQLLGPAPTTAINIIKDIMKPEREAMTTAEKAKAIARKIPSLKPIVNAIDLMTGDTDVTTPNGEVAYRRSTGDMIAGLGGFRSANEANSRLAVDAIIAIQKQESELKNAYYVANQKGDTSAVEDKIDKFNNIWPEVAITKRQLRDYVRSRQRSSGKTEQEKISKGKYKKLLPE